MLRHDTQAVYLKGIGKSLPVISIDGKPELDPANNLTIKFSVAADSSLKLEPPELFYSLPDASWVKRKWIKLEEKAAEAGNGKAAHSYTITMPAAIASQNIDWFLMASENNDTRATAVSTLIYSTNNKERK